MSASCIVEVDSERSLSGITDRLDKLIVLIEAQTRYMSPASTTEKTPKEKENPILVLQEVSECLRKMDERQAAADMISKQPFPQSSATSAGAWSALLRSHMSNVEPIVSQWRGTLDTLLIFVALFSAVVTALYVQSLTGLSPDTGARTNELLQNLTEVIIALQGTNATQLNIAQPSSFTPDANVVRLNFYWSVSLVLSISVAALAVTSRGYVAMLTRSGHRQAHKKLGELHHRWVEAKRLLAPAIETLPQLLIAPLLFFIIGVLDMLLSSSIPVSNSDVLLLVAGVVSCVSIIAVGAYTIWTVVHCCMHPEVSPYQSALSTVLVEHGPGWFAPLKNLPATCKTLWRKLMTGIGSVKDVYLLPIFRGQHHGPDHFPRDDSIIAEDTQDSEQSFDAADSYGPNDALTMDEHIAFHAVLYQTHEDDILDIAAAALLPLSRSRQPVPWILQMVDDAPRPTSLEKETTLYLLSSEASIRSNLTAAAAICLFEPRALNHSIEECEHMLNVLSHAATRYSYGVSGSPRSLDLWNSPFSKAMSRIVLSLKIVDHDLQQVYEDILSKAPLVGMLLTDRRMIRIEYSSQDRPSPEGCPLFKVDFALDVLGSCVKPMMTPCEGVPFVERDLVERVFSSSGILSLIDAMQNGDGYHPWEGSEKGVRYWNHPSFVVLTLGLNALGPSETYDADQQSRFYTSIGVLEWFITRYYHNSLRSLRVDLPYVLKFFLREHLAVTWRLDRRYLLGHQGAQNMFWLSVVLYEFYRAFVLSNSPDDSYDVLQVTIEFVNVMFETNRLAPWSKQCPLCENELFPADSDLCSVRSSSFCRFAEDLMKIVKVIHRRTPSVRLTVEDMNLVYNCLSNPGGGPPSPHRTVPHSEKVRHKLLKMFLKLAPEVPVWHGDFQRAEPFGKGDFIEIPWAWLESECPPDVVGEPNMQVGSLRRDYKTPMIIGQQWI